MRRGPFPIPLLLVPIAALIAVLPLILHGCSCGHDFDFHLVGWMEAAAQFRAGSLHPAWAFSPAWNSGEPRFVFYPPISWTLGGVLGMLLQWAAVPIIYTWMALTFSGLSMHRLVRDLDGGRAGCGALVAAVLYLVNPYMLFTAYERAAYAELLAAAWIPLLLAAILRERVTVFRIAIPVALLWLTNAPAAVIGSYTLGLLAALRVAELWLAGRQRSHREIFAECMALAGRVMGGTALGLGLAAFYIVPAAYERRWVQIAMATISGMRIEDNFLFHHTGDGPHDAVLHTASMIAGGILIAAFVVVLVLIVGSRNESSSATRVHRMTRHCATSLAVLVAAIGLLLTPLSADVWRIAPEMAFLQFPWRLTAVLAAVACGGIGALANSLKVTQLAVGLATLALAAAMVFPEDRAFRQGCDEEDTVAARTEVFAVKTGTVPTDEYTPTDADNDVLAHANPPFWLADDAGAMPADGSAKPGPVPMHFAFDAVKDATLVLNLREYPAWQVRRNGEVMTQRITRDDGLIALPVTAGRSLIDIDYRTTLDRRVGDAISLVSLCVGLVMLGRRRAWPAKNAALSRIIVD